MRIIEGEMDLRDETRSVEQAHDAVKPEEYMDRANGLSKTQDTLNQRLEKVAIDIRTLPDGEANFAKELGILASASKVMAKATSILAEPDTGPQAIAAETEVLELLLQSKRMNPGGGGGGGSSPGGGGGGDTDTPALALYGAGADPNAQVQHRQVRQTTGTTGDELPAEYRIGLEAFFEAVENER